MLSVSLLMKLMRNSTILLPFLCFTVIFTNEIHDETFMFYTNMQMTWPLVAFCIMVM